MNYLFVGPQSCLKEKAIDDLKSKYLSEDARHLDYNLYHAGSDNINDILNCINTLPFLGKFRMVVIKEIGKLSFNEKKTLIKYLKKPAQRTILVLDVDEEPKNDEFFKKLATLIKKLDFKFINLTGWIKKEASLHNKGITKEAEELLVKLLGRNNLSKIKNELEKASIYVGEKKEILKSDIEEIVDRSADEDIFKLIDSISQKDIERSLGIIQDLILRKSKPHEILGLLSWHFRNIFMNPESAHSFSRNNLKRNVEILLTTDIAIKRSRLNPVMALEFAIFKLCS